MMQQARSASRLRSFLKGRIRFNGGLRSLECLVRDISATGARLEISEAVSLPDRFELYLPHQAITHNASIEWRRGNQLGITFGGAKGSSSNSSEEREMVTRVQHLEAEVGLMRLLTEMKAELGAHSGKQIPFPGESKWPPVSVPNG